MYIEPSSHYLGNWSPRARAVFLHVAEASASVPFEDAGFGFVIHGEFAPFQGLPFFLGGFFSADWLDFAKRLLSGVGVSNLLCVGLGLRQYLHRVSHEMSLRLRVRACWVPIRVYFATKALMIVNYGTLSQRIC